LAAFSRGVAWLGLLYFFNLVNVPFMKELDPATKSKILPASCRAHCGGFAGDRAHRAHRPSLLGSIVASDARNADATSQATSGVAMEPSSASGP